MLQCLRGARDSEPGLRGGQLVSVGAVRAIIDAQPADHPRSGGMVRDLGLPVGTSVNTRVDSGSS